MNRIELHAKLQSLCPVPLALRLHQNRSTYASACKKGGVLHLALHELFLSVPDDGIQAAVQFALTGSSAARRILRRYAEALSEEAPCPPTQPIGSTYDLRLFLPPDAEVEITWGKHAPTAFRSITFGSYDRAHRLIRINPLLDHPVVPATFLSCLVHHEYLHHLIPPRITPSGRMSVHPPEFRRAEALHPHFEEAKRWERRALNILKRVYHGRS